MEDNKQSDEEFFNEPLDLPGEPDTDDWVSSMPKRSWKRPIIIAVVIILIVFGGFFAWQLLTDTNDTDTTDQATEQVAPTPAASNQAEPGASEDDIPAVTSTEQAKTSSPRMEVTYPTNWTLTEGEDDVTIESPAFGFTTANNTVIDDGVFRLYLRQGARESDSNYIGRGVASLASESLTYTDPALGQREDTNVSFFGLDRSDHISFLFIAGNFSLSVGDTLGPDFGQAPDTYIIAGGYSSPALEDDLEMHSMSPQVFQSTNAYKQALGIIRSLRLF